MKNLTWQNPEQLFVAQELINKVKSKCCGIKDEILVNHLKAQYMRNQLKALDKICIECTFYGEYCDGGCFIENDRISKDDILNNTFFPTL